MSKKQKPRGPGRPDRPTVEHYTDYRAFLRDVYAWRKSQADRYSFQRLADESGAGTPAFLNMVFKGKRNLSHDAAEGVGKALGLSVAEIRFLKKLIKMDRTDDPVEKQKDLRKLARRTKFREKFRISADHLDYLSNWYILAIHEMVGFPEFQPDPRWISANLLPSVTPAQARDALEILERLGLIESDDDGNVRRTVHRIETPDEIHHAMVRGYHAQATETARWAISTLAPDDRNFGVVSGRVTTKGMRRILKRLHRMRQELGDLFAELETDDGDVVVQINVQGFPVTTFDENK